MPQWQNSSRHDRLPPDWAKLRRLVLKRDHEECQAPMRTGTSKASDGTGKTVCGDEATDVDHIEPGDDHSLGNLQALCDWHHKKKSGLEGAAAVNRKRRAIKKKFRRTESHPGLL